MKENDNSLEKAVEALKNEHIPPGPPQELADATIAKLAEASEQSDTVKIENRIRIIERLKAARSLAKFAAAAVLLIVAGYATGRLSAPRPPDMEQLQAALEPAIRQNLDARMKHYLQLGLANSYVQLKDELSEQYRRDLSRFAVQTLAASNTVTNELLTELVRSINAVQTEDLRRVAAALDQMELNRRQDRTLLANGLEILAYQTEEDLQRTRQDMVQLLAYAQPRNIVPNVPESSDIPNERNKE